MLIRVKIRQYNPADCDKLYQALLDYNLAQNVIVAPEAIKGDYTRADNAFDVLNHVIAFQNYYGVTLELEVNQG